MKTQSRAARRSGCPIGMALDIFGDTWSLLIVRDLMFKGLNTFNDFLQAGEGIASNVLTNRLARLEERGIIRKEADPHDARRYRYNLTPKGMELAPVLVEIVLWAARHEQTDAPAAIVKQMRTNRARVIAGIRKRWMVRSG